ncbi:MAG: Calx-beta domain-containing protein, partial [Planctomycetaceae bacterium]
GSVTFDATKYASDATATVTVADADRNLDDAAADTVTVLVSSTTESSGFNLTLTETTVASGVFTADVTIEAGSANPDNVLQVADGDTLTVLYSDPDPVSDHTDTAIIDGSAPDISNVSDTSGSTSAVVSWITNEDATGVVRYGLSSTSLTSTATASTAQTSQSVALPGLTSSTTYYYQVTATDVVGNASTEPNVHSFTTSDAPNILLIDDDQGETNTQLFANALDASTLFYDTWTVTTDGAPSASDLSNYQVVLWNCGDNYTASTAGLTSSEQGVIQTYLDGGGNIFVGAQDALYNGLGSSFYTNYLGVDNYQNDLQGVTILGVSNDPISDGVNTTLSFPSGVSNWSDLVVPVAAADGVFLRSSTPGDFNSIRYDSGSFRSVFFAFCFEALPISAAAPNNQATVIARIVDWLGEEEAPPLPIVSAGDATVTEGGVASLTLTLSAVSDADVTVSYATSNGSAVDGLDYTGVSTGSATIAAGTLTTTVTVSTTDDALDENSETFNVDLTGATNATVGDGRGVVTIEDNDAAPTITINNTSIDEGNSGSKSATLTVTLSAASGRAVSVNYATDDDSATTGDGDYNSASGTLNFAAGDTTRQITVAVNGDTKYELDEAFHVNLSAASNATIGDGTGRVTLNNDDSPPDISINDVELAEGHSGTTAFTFTVSLSQASAIAATVDYATGGGTAVAGEDYAATSGTLTFAAGTLSQTVTVDVSGDTTPEGDETFNVSLSNASHANLIDNEGVGTILEDDRLLSINNVSVNEFDGTAIFAVTLNSPSSQPVTVDYHTEDGTAAAGEDYTVTAGTLEFGPGEIRKELSVPIIDDLFDEFPETFSVFLTNPNGAGLGDGEGEGTIGDNDPPPVITINNSSVIEGDSGTTPMTFTVELSQASGKPVSVDYATGFGSALPGDDYVSKTGTVSFSVNETSKSVSIDVKGDHLHENHEAFFVNLSNPSNATIGTAQAQGIILNDDLAPSTVEIISGYVSSITETWVTVSLPVTMNDPVIVATPANYPGSIPVWTQMRNVTNDTFDLRVVPLEEFVVAIDPVEVWIMAANAGEYSGEGLNMEAGTVEISTTDRRGSWNGETVAYQGSYDNPVVVGQVMTANDGGDDPRVSTFWSRSETSRRNVPNSSGMRIGKHVGEDPDRSRPTETVGYIVIETGFQELGDIQLSAQVTADRVRGTDNYRPYFVGMPSEMDYWDGTVATGAGVDGNDGYQATFAVPPDSTGVQLAAQEDYWRDYESNHTTEQVALVFVGSATASGASAAAFGQSSAGKRLATRPARSGAAPVDDAPLSGLFSTSVSRSIAGPSMPVGLGAAQPISTPPVAVPTESPSSVSSHLGGPADGWWSNTGDVFDLLNGAEATTPAPTAVDPLELLLTGGLFGGWGQIL